MPTDDAVAAVAALRRGDHVCWTYADDAEHAAVLHAFLVAGLPAGERLLYFGTDAEVADVLSGLTASDDDPAELIRTGRLVVGDAEAGYLPDGAFRPADRADGFREVARQAVADGYSGIRVAGENTPLLNHPEVYDDWYDYELRVEILIAGEPILGMCCFDRRACHPSALAMLDAVHRVQLATPPGPSLPFTVHGRADGALALTGEVDAFCTDELTRILVGTARRPEPMLLDLRGLTFIDSAGVRALERVARRGRAGRGPLLLHGATEPVRRVVTLLGRVDDDLLVLAE